MQKLYWENTYEIVLALMEAHPNAEIEDIGMEQLKGWVLDLPDFDDDPALINDGILHDILREWYEETSGEWN